MLGYFFENISYWSLHHEDLKSLCAAGIATAPHVVVGPHAWKRDPEAILEACRSLSYPLFVKPARAGSSLGISKVEHPEDLPGAIEAARAVDPKVLVETGIVGCEVEVVVLEGCDDDVLRVAEPDEIAIDTSQHTKDGTVSGT